MSTERTENNDLSEPFRAMAQAIEHNVGKDNFGGAAVIIPPATPGVAPNQSVEVLILDASGDASQFFATIVTRIQMLTRAMDDKRAQWGAPMR